VPGSWGGEYHTGWHRATRDRAARELRLYGLDAAAVGEILDGVNLDRGAGV
jgi:hypothetical protein